LQLYRYKFLQDPTAPLQHDPISEFFDGACIPTDQWTYPASLQKEVYDAVGYYRTPNLPFEYDYPGFVAYVQEEETLIEDCYDTTREQDDIVIWLLKNKPWDFFFFANMPNDRLNHNMTRIEGNPDWSPEYEYKYGKGKVMKDFAKFFDKELTRILKVVPKDTYLIFISDHGWSPVKKEFQPNSWLKQIGLLHVKPEVEGKRRKYEFPDDVDWTRTKAYSPDNPGIFINLKGRELHGIVDYSEYEKLRDFIIEELKKVRDPEGNLYVHIADRVENIYKGNYGWYAGDVQFCGYRDSSGIKVPGRTNDGMCPINWTGFGKQDAIWDDPRRHWTAWHGNALTSFIMTGPGVKKNVDISKNGHMMNVMPTIFHIFGLVPPPNFEGRIMYEAFESNCPLAKKRS
ncbi:MAG: alkaline phosphatase family protein, partial [bacterium]